MSYNIKPVGLADFTKEVINAEGPVLVDFWAAYCGPCRQLKPVLEQVAGQGVKVVTVDITAEPELTQHYGVSAIPTIVQFKDGKPGNRVVGLKNVKDLIELAAA